MEIRNLFSKPLWGWEREVGKKLESKCKDMDCYLMPKPKIPGVPYRPDFIIKDTRGHWEAIIEIEAKKMHLVDMARIVDIAKSYSEQVEKGVPVCLITKAGVTQAVEEAAPKYGIRIIPYGDFDCQFNAENVPYLFAPHP
ncbi:hypothetical protein M1N57_01460 [Dehalococcoidales bacterium]|nr:hypothetical protein [Dehalococcoidales bacterium]